MPVIEALGYITGSAIGKAQTMRARVEIAKACLQGRNRADSLTADRPTRRRDDIMLEWLNETAGPGYASAMLWTLGALALLLVVLIGIRVFRSLTFGTYVMGGRQRRHRLAVSDATAVDSHRRLVLVRRDDVEHLILIGGPTDVVVEQNIRTVETQPAAADERPRIPAPAPKQAARSQPEAQPRAAEPRLPSRPAAPSSSPAAEAPPRPRPVEAVRPAAPAQPARPEPVRQPSSQDAAIPAAVRRDIPAQPTAPQAAPMASRAEPVRREPSIAVPPRMQPADKDLDAALLDELNVTLEGKASAAGGDLTLEDEMNKLLGELSEAKRG